MLSAAACSDNETPDNNVSDVGDLDVGLADQGSDPDVAVAPDAGVDPDVASDLPEEVGADAGEETVPTEGFGDISGECGVIDLEAIDSSSSYLFRNAIDFDVAYNDGLIDELSEGSQEMIADGNAGGSSINSEVFAYEVLHRCELATLLKTETEVVYDTAGSITDLLVDIDGRKIGVSVTRAVGWPREDPWTEEQATTLLTRKLTDIQESSANVAAEDAWDKQILHVIAYAPEHADSVAAAYASLDPSVTADTIVIVTVSDGLDAFIYE